jgi:hypothetical protein
VKENRQSYGYGVRKATYCIAEFKEKGYKNKEKMDVNLKETTVELSSHGFF